MNREEYLSHQLDRVLGRGNVFTSREVYLFSVRRDINSEVPSCPNAQTTPDLDAWKGSPFAGLRSECTGCGFTVEAVS